MFWHRNNLLYVSVNRNLISARNPRNGEFCSLVPIVAVVRGSVRNIVICGEDVMWHCSERQVTVLNPFFSLTQPPSQWMGGVEILQYLFRQVRGRKVWASDLRVLIHFDGELLAGATQEVLDALLTMVLSAGASEVKLWFGSTLSEAHLLQGRFPGHQPLGQKKALRWRKA